MDIKEVEKKTKLKNGTIRNWIKILGINVSKDKDGKLIFTPDNLKALEEHKQKKQNKKGMGSAARHKTETLQAEIIKSEPLPLRLDPHIQFVHHYFKDLFSKELERFAGISEKYAKINFELGGIKANIKYFEDKIKDLESRVISLEKINGNLKEENINLKIELAKKEAELIRLSRGFWGRIFK